MKLSGGVEWGLHCCVVLSQSPAPVPARRLAEYHGVSSTYLAKHLQALARAGLIRALEGRSGGYELTRDATDISMLDVVLAIDGDAPAFCCTEIRQRGPLAAPAEACTKPCSIAKAMADAEAAWRTSLQGVSVADLAGQVRRDAGTPKMDRMRAWLAPA